MSRQNLTKNLTLKSFMINVCITTSGKMYAKREMRDHFHHWSKFNVTTKVVHDDTLLEKQEIILAKKENKN